MLTKGWYVTSVSFVRLRHHFRLYTVLCLRDELRTRTDVSNEATKAEILGFPAYFPYFHYTRN